MPTFPTRQELVAMIVQAMKDRNPALYEELWATGSLALALERRASQAEDSYLAGLSGMLEASGRTHDEIVTAAYLARDLAVENAIHQATDF
jgi:hypothetical protein